VAAKTDVDAAAKLAAAMTAKVDLDRHFEVAPDGLQPLPDEPGAALLDQLASLWHFYACVGSFGQAPALTFDNLIGAPGVIHTILGDTVWKGFWGDKADGVTRSNYVPMSMHKMLQHVVGSSHEKLSAMAGKEDARVKFDTAKSQTASMKLGYSSPY